MKTSSGLFVVVSISIAGMPASTDRPENPGFHICLLAGPKRHARRRLSVGTLDEALKLAKDETMHGALLDVNIDGGRVDDVAAILAQRDVPFVFVTGYGRANLPPLFQDAVVVAKPFKDEDLLREVRQMGPN